MNFTVGMHHSPSGDYRLDISSIVERNNQTFYAATILKKVRAYWEPVKSGLYLTEKELAEYYV